MACVSRCFISVWFPGKNLQKLEVRSGSAQKHMFSRGIAMDCPGAEGWSHQTAQGSIQRMCGFDGLALQISRGKCYIVEWYRNIMNLASFADKVHLMAACPICKMVGSAFFGPSHWNFITEHEPYSYITSAQSVSCPLCSGGCYVQ